MCPVKTCYVPPARKSNWLHEMTEVALGTASMCLALALICILSAFAGMVWALASVVGIAVLPILLIVWSISEGGKLESEEGEVK